MPITSLFAGFNTAVRSMQQAQYAIGVHGSNIANAQDETYTRRDVLPASSTAVSGPGIARSRDSFVETQYRNASGVLGNAEARKDVMSKVEDIFGDPVDGGIRQSIDNFYDAWQGLAENPSDGVARMQVITAGQSFCQNVKLAYSQISDVEQTVNEELTVRVSDVNTKLDQLFDLNKRISELTRNHMNDADLRDQRDRALDDLAKLTGAQAIDNGDGTIRVTVGSTVVLDGPTVTHLTLVNSGTTPVPTWNGYNQPTFGGSGTISGLVSVRDTEIAGLKTDIDNLAKQVATSVNAVHVAGKGLDGVSGRNFFNITAAPADIQVDPNLQVDQVAAGGAAGSGEPSDGENARLVAQAADAPLLSSVIIPGQMQSPRVYYRNLVGWIGSRAKDANDLADVSTAHVQVSGQQRQSQWGVSLDEETAKMQMEQRAFQAAARVVTTMDDMLDTLINKTLR